VIGTLYDGLVRALKMPAVREGFAKEGSDVVIDASPAVFSRFRNIGEGRVAIGRDDRIDGYAAF
jgi:hypothetical protein